MSREEHRQEHNLLNFGAYRLDARNAQLWRGQEVIRLTNKALAVLRYLVEHGGQLVTKDDLFAAVWPGVIVSDAALVVCIGELRRALGDERRTPQFIETVQGRGYRFIREVVSDPEEEESQKAKGKNQKAKGENGLESENQTPLPPSLQMIDTGYQTPDVQPSLPTPPVRHIWSRGNLLLLGLLFLGGGGIVAHYLSLSTPSP